MPISVKVPHEDLDEAYRAVMKHVPAGKWMAKKDMASMAFRIGLKQVKGMNLERVLEALNRE